MAGKIPVKDTRIQLIGTLISDVMYIATTSSILGPHKYGFLMPRLDESRLDRRTEGKPIQKSTDVIRPDGSVPAPILIRN